MKPGFPNRFLAVFAAPAALVFTASHIHAVTNYQGAADNWALSTNWSGGVVPTGAFNQRLNFNPGTTVTFGAAQGTVDIGGSTSGEARAFVMGNTNPTLNPSVAIATLNITGGILRASTSATVTGTASSSLVGANGSNSTAILNVSGGVLDLTTAGAAQPRVLAIGLGATANTGISGTVNLSGSGLIKVSEFRFADSAPNAGGSITGVLNLNGGTLETGLLREPGASGSALVSSTVNLNGGLLRLTAATGIMSTLDTVNVLSGANIEVITGVTAASGKDLLAVGVGGLTKSGDGTLSLTSASNYTGATAIGAGTLSAGKIDVSGGSSSLGNATSAVTLGSAGALGTLSYTGNSATYTRGFMIGGAGGGRLDVTTAGQTLTVDTGAITGSGLFTVGGTGLKIINAAITHSGGITKTSGSGSITLSNSTNSYTGVTDITGALIVTANNALGDIAGGTTVNANSTLGLSGGIDYAATETVSGSGIGTGAIAGITPAISRGFIQSVSGNNTFRGNIELNANGMSRIGTQNGASLTLSGTITQATGITTANILFRAGDTAGDYVTLSNSGNSFGGNSQVYSNVTAGNYAGLRLGVNDALPTSLTVSGFIGAGAGTALDLNGKIQTLNGLISGDAGLNIINSDTVNNSTLTLDPTANLATNNTVIRGGVGLGTINVVKDGAFTQTLSETHDYTGTTAVNDGTLRINGNVSTSNITVGSTATLGGTGSIGGTVTVNNGGTLSSGASIESLATGALTLNGGSTFDYEMDNDAAASAAGDLTAVTGNLTLDLSNLAVLTLTEEGAGSWTVGEKLTLISYTGLWNGGLFKYGATLADDSTFTFSGVQWEFNYNDNDAGDNFIGDLTGSSFVTMTVIPEPRAALLGGLGLLALLRRRR